MAKPACAHCKTIIEDAKDYFAVNGIAVHLGCVQSYMPSKSKNVSGTYMTIDEDVFFGRNKKKNK